MPADAQRAVEAASQLKQQVGLGLESSQGPETLGGRRWLGVVTVVVDVEASLGVFAFGIWLFASTVSLQRTFCSYRMNCAAQSTVRQQDKHASRVTVLSSPLCDIFILNVCKCSRTGGTAVFHPLGSP